MAFSLIGLNLRDYPPKKPPASCISFAMQLLQALKSLHHGEIVYGVKPIQQLTTVLPTYVLLAEIRRTNKCHL